MKCQQHASKPRTAFTLLELLGVITVIAILIALLVPALFNVFDNARNAEVSAEFSRLTTAITSFATDHNGVQPYSAILFDESGSWRDPGNAPVDRALRLSQTRIRRIWPSFTFAAVDLNGDGDTTDRIEITASECLVFFLGGLRTPGTQGLTGFSKNPAMPFTLVGDNREGPWYTFAPDQLVDTDNDGMLEYVDSLPDQQVPILFVSSNNGQGYSKTDGSLNYYVQSDGKTPWNKDSFQLISPGADGDFGFDPAPNPFDSSGTSTDSRPRYGDGITLPKEQEDNIANFAAGGTLR